MSEGNLPPYQYSTTNNTRAALQSSSRKESRRSQKQKRGIDPVGGDEPPLKKTKGRRKDFESPLAADDPLRNRDKPLDKPTRSHTSSLRSTPAISRAQSQESDSQSGRSGIRTPAELEPGSSGLGRSNVVPPTRFATAINEHTDFMSGLDSHQLVDAYGVPLPAMQALLDDELEEDEAARNSNVEKLAEFAKGLAPVIYANCVLRRKGPPSTLTCSECRTPDSARWRCDSCQTRRDLCAACLRKTHMATPFHRVRYNTGTQFREATLRDVGVYIQLCPEATGTDHCPAYSSSEHVLPSDIDTRTPPTYGTVLDVPPAHREAGHGQQEPGYGRGPSGLRPADQGAPDPPGNRPDPMEPGASQDEELWPDDQAGGEMDEGDAEAELKDAEDIEEGASFGESGQTRVRGREAIIKKDCWGHQVLVIVDKTDIHQLGVSYCKCRAGRDLPPYQQLLQLGGLFPATESRPRTCFTLEGLAYHQVDRLECRVAPQAMVRKLRRHTSPLHPSTVPNRYLEALRVIREYTVVDNLIVHGFAHQPVDDWKPPPPGGLFYRCVVCPSKRNLPRGHKNDPNSWAFYHTFAHDGNFSGQHTVSLQPGNNIPLFPGTGAFQHPDEAKADLAAMKTDKQVRKEAEHLFAKDKPCNKHLAAQVSGKTRDKVTDIKGIGAWACARHGEFAAGGTCNYELGEASGPADVALNNTFKLNTDPEVVDRLQLFYDIWCRYGVHLRERFNRTPNVSWPEFAEVLGSVGVWHIYGHVFECYGRWSSLYARHCGIVDGEILETLWSVLNQILETCRGMSLAHREEVISMFESDSNHRKNLNMVDTIAKKFEKYIAEAARREAIVAQLSACTSPENVTTWEAERLAFERDRINDSSIADTFFQHELVQVTSRKETEVQLLEQEASQLDGKGLVKAIIDAMNLQVDQLKLQALDKQATSTGDRRAVATSRTRINQRVNKCNEAMAAALGSRPGRNELQKVRLQPLMKEDEWGPPEGERETRRRYNLREGAEFRAVDMPSSRSDGWRKGLQLEQGSPEMLTRRRAMDIQAQLCVALMNESLGEIRTRIVDQANTYLQRIRSTRGHANVNYHERNVAHEEARRQGKAVRIHAQIYNACREKLAKLGWEGDAVSQEKIMSWLLRYRVLRSEDLICSTATYSTRGTVPDFSLPWFWRMVAANPDEPVEVTRKKDEEFIAAFFRIRWINARCSLVRCQEELIILHFEMQMCYLGYKSLADDWIQRKQVMSGQVAHEYMAAEMASNWTDMANYGRERFNMCHKDVITSSLST
ncbi:unnamed protein product [Peniophora sp. CBMAI 1063]|nr:unnamed protein product [Peniophora sp. CBMAI 1063]